MTARAEEPAMQGGGERLPRAIRFLALAAVGLLAAGAGYLIWARGEAMLVDLATLAGKAWCF